MLNWLKKILSVPEKARHAIAIESTEETSTGAARLRESASYKSQGNKLLDEGNLDNAAACYRHAIATNPDDAGAYLSLGFVLKEQKLHEEAERYLKQAATIDPSSSDTFYILGTISQEQGNLQGAIENFNKALELKPDFEIVYRDLCRALFQSGQNENAKQVILKGISLNPEWADFHYYLGNLYFLENEPGKAIASFRKALSIQPDYVNVHCNLGLALQAQGKIDAAIECYQQALAIQPDYADAHGNLGMALQAQGKYDTAIECYRHALTLKPDYAEAHSNLAGALMKSYRYRDALPCAQRAVELNPRLASAHQTLAMIYGYLSDYAKVTEHSNAALAIKADDHDIWESRLYIYSYHPDLSVEAIFAEFVRWGDRFPAPPPNAFADHDRTPERRLRVGYVSPDFRQHTSRFFFEPLFANHDPGQVELFAYSNVLKEDSYTMRFKELFDHWRDIRGVPDREVAALIGRDRVDILVDGCNHMVDERLGVFVHKPAPLQVTWLGAAWTTGLPMIDYVLFDRHQAPEGTLAREKIVRLPGSFIVYRPPPGTPAVAPSPAPKNGHVTFGYSGRSERLNHRVFRLWGEILRRLPDARLILDYWPFADVPTRDYYRLLLAEHGVDVARVTMRKSANIFERLADIDILLDVFPHNGGTMLIDALWMGVPALTLASRPPLGRIGASLMSNIGLENWVAHNATEYVDKAVEFAGNYESLQVLRAGMRERMRNSPLMDEAGFAADVEAAYRTMWQRWCKGQQAMGFDGKSSAALSGVANQVCPPA